MFEFHPGDYAGDFGSYRTFWTPFLPPSRCSERCRRHAEKGRKVGELCRSVYDRRPHPVTRTTRVFAVCVSRFPAPVSSHLWRITYSHAAARWFSDERAYLFYANNSNGLKNSKSLKVLKQVEDAFPSFAMLYNLLIPPYFGFSKHGTSHRRALETLPPNVYSNSARQRASWPGEKHMRKRRKSINKSPESS